MKVWTRKHTLNTGVALILATNSIALIGAAYNRGGDPESVLRLTQRELRPPYQWKGNRENSGMALQLRWRVINDLPASQELEWGYSVYGMTPEWLDQVKMEALSKFQIQHSTVTK